MGWGVGEGVQGQSVLAAWTTPFLRSPALRTGAAFRCRVADLLERCEQTFSFL